VDVQIEVRIGRVELCDGVERRQRGAHRAFGIVLVGPRGAVEHEDRIADELRHRPAQALELAADAGVVGAQQAVDVLGVHGLGARGEAHEIAEERRDHLALLLETGAATRCQLSAACATEPKTLGVLASAAVAEHLRAITAPDKDVNQYKCSAAPFDRGVTR
jgi:hypothetical protein